MALAAAVRRATMRQQDDLCRPCRAKRGRAFLENQQNCLISRLKVHHRRKRQRLDEAYWLFWDNKSIVVTQIQLNNISIEVLLSWRNVKPAAWVQSTQAPGFCEIYSARYIGTNTQIQRLTVWNKEEILHV